MRNNGDSRVNSISLSSTSSSLDPESSVIKGDNSLQTTNLTMKVQVYSGYTYLLAGKFTSLYTRILHAFETPNGKGWIIQIEN